MSSSSQKVESLANANSESEELNQVDTYFEGISDKIGVNAVEIDVPSSYYMEHDSHSDEDDCRDTDQDSNQEFDHLFVKGDRLAEVNRNVQGEMYTRPMNFHDDSSESEISEYAPYEGEGESENEAYEDDNVQVTAELRKEDELSDEEVVLPDTYAVDTR